MDWLEKTLVPQVLRRLAALEAWQASQTILLQDENLRLRQQVKDLSQGNADLMDLLKHKATVPVANAPVGNPGKVQMRDLVAQASHAAYLQSLGDAKVQVETHAAESVSN